MNTARSIPGMLDKQFALYYTKRTQKQYYKYSSPQLIFGPDCYLYGVCHLGNRSKSVKECLLILISLVMLQKNVSERADLLALVCDV